MSFEQLKLENQLCFPLYAISRLITKAYQPELEKLNLTYPQYLVLMVLWEESPMPVNDIAKKLILNTNTITPLIQRMEKQKLIKKVKSPEDERKVLVSLTEKGESLREKAKEIPLKMMEKIIGDSPVSESKILELQNLKNNLDKLLIKLQNQLK